MRKRNNKTKKLDITVVDRPSPNFNDRKGQSVLFLIMHYTAMKSAEDAIKRLSDPAAGVSSHYVVGADGQVYRLVPEDKRSWHAGKSFWDGHSDLNTTSVGIEIDNDGSSPYPDVQMQALNALSQQIIKRHNIKAAYVIGHSDIAPDRKQDPGAHFDWKSLAASGIGIWPVPTKSDYSTSAAWGGKTVMDNLVKLGYQSGHTSTDLITAFQRHFQPEVFSGQGKVGIADGETRARLACLLRRKAISDGLRAGQGKKNKKHKKNKK